MEAAFSFVPSYGNSSKIKALITIMILYGLHDPLEGVYNAAMIEQKKMQRQWV